MADKRIDELVAVEAIADNDLLIVQDTSQAFTTGDETTIKTKKSTMTLFLNYLVGKLFTPEVFTANRLAQIFNGYSEEDKELVAQSLDIERNA